ncbi:uncharacterized protein LOC135676591 isoform X1 [Musa acuminata AAA Group]|uniref:uncharacterized protein LOC135676591 isoform X1 n=1 Tax=Musa acuminata AAA Group TaxID=214697 RepID=UPI0031DAAB82
MAVPLLTKKIFEKPVKKLKTPQSDRKICVKELELEAKLEDRSEKHRRKSRGGKHHTNSPHMGSSSRHKQENNKTAISWPSSKQDQEDCCTHEDDGLRDTEVEEFLHSRFKNGMKLVHIFHRHVLIKMVTRQVMMCG